MKRVLFLTFMCAVISTISANAQYYSDNDEVLGTFKAGAGYTHDFPGLNGVTFLGEYSHSLYNRLEGAFAMKHIRLNGHPRSASVNEYTKSTTAEFIIYYLPMQNDNHILRVGLGYAFSFYKIRRSYPVEKTTGTEKSITWNPQEKQGRVSGVSLIGEYQYLIPESNLSVGIRAALYRAYDRVSYFGPFVGVRL